MVAGGLLLPATVLGHALLVSATPAPGATLTTAPALVHLEFTEPVNPSFSGLTITGPAGEVRTAIRFPASDPRGMEAELPSLAPGRYSVEWHTLSLIDGHTRSGAYSFGVLDAAGNLPPAPPLTIHSSATPLPGWLDAAARWALLLALAYLLGGLAFATLVEPRRGPPVRAAGDPGRGAVDAGPGTPAPRAAGNPGRGSVFPDRGTPAARVGGDLGPGSVDAAPVAPAAAGSRGRGSVGVVGGRGATLAAAIGIAGLAESVASSAAGSAGLGAIPQVATGSFAGQASLVMAVAIVVLAWSAVRPVVFRALAGWSAGVIALLALAATSHVAAGPGAAWGTLAMAVHAGAALTWTGGLVHLARAWVRPESVSGARTSRTDLSRGSRALPPRPWRSSSAAASSRPWS